MKRNLQIITTASALSVLACSALAQDTTKPKTDRPGYTRHRLSHEDRANRLNGAVKASDVIGMTVHNYQNEKLGKVEELAVDVESGRVVQAILSVGGFAGIGDTLTAVPPGALHYDVARKVVHLDANKEKLKGAPKFEMSRWAESSESNYLSSVYGYYGEQPAFRFIHRGDSAQDGLPAPDSLRNPDGRPDTDAARRGEGIRGRDRVSRDTNSLIPVSRLSQVQKASKLMGTPVKNLQDEKLGDVENILVDLPSGRIVAVIVASGGFLGLGEELSAVPPTALRFNPARDTFQLDASKEMLSNAPHFKADQWPDFAQPGYAHGVYRAYNVEPYFTTNATTDADNTARNVRDRDHRSLTPLDQGNSRADTDTTAQIRKGIVAEKNMSVNAKNVKIITQKGRVTLRGVVNTAEEKRAVAEIANRIARSENVDNQLEVKLGDN